jgi:hypothetical protein
VKREPDPLVVDGYRESVEWAAGLPSAWTTEGERLVLLVMACDAYGRESAPGIDNIAAWTGMRRTSVIRAINHLLKPTEDRQALLVKTKKSRGGPRATSVYHLLTTVSEQSPRETDEASQQSPNSLPRRPLRLATVSEQSPRETDEASQQSPNSLPTVSLGDPPSPSPDKLSLSPQQRAVAKALGLQDDDEKLAFVDKMLEDNGAQKPSAWIQTCQRNGDLTRLLDEAQESATATSARHEAADSRRCIHGKINGEWTCEECAAEATAQPKTEAARTSSQDPVGSGTKPPPGWRDGETAQNDATDSPEQTLGASTGPPEPPEAPETNTRSQEGTEPPQSDAQDGSS